ncbi:hypothetical protein MRBBS_1393 [Marinobacter sp. BSs20148]|nr:hypothetical protein MRBBS_1393 [Marinobacter sp. BSs20148]
MNQPFGRGAVNGAPAIGITAVAAAVLNSTAAATAHTFG